MPHPGPLPASDLAACGWDDDWSSNLAALGDPTLTPARVLRENRTNWLLWAATGEVLGEPSGTMLSHLASGARPTSGDWVAIRQPASESRAIVHALLPRRNAIVRRAAGTRPDEQVIAANVDIVLIVGGLDGDHNLRRLERYLALVRDGGSEPVIVLNKRDLCRQPEVAIADVTAIAGESAVHAVSARDGFGLDALDRYLRPGRTLALIGSSGAGKSSLINALLGHGLQATGDVRADDSRGRHTTTARELILHPAGCAILDTPGMRELQLLADAGSIEAGFNDIAGLARNCRFRDCTHGDEPGCAVRMAVEAGVMAAERLASLQKLRGELAHEQRKSAQRSRREARNRPRQVRRGQWSEDE